MEPRIATYGEFWPFYLREHSKHATKQWHVYGTLAGIVVGAYLGVTCHAAYLLTGFIIGYGCSWYSHFFIEKNRPATFKYPLWSFISDFRMAFLFLTGKLK
jgi:hypothetical protein